MIEVFTENVFLTTLAGFFLGATLGSFINVCASRIPLGHSVILPPSSCPRCRARIPWHHNIPILTWLSFRGRAKCCQYEIPPRYFLTELATALLCGYFFHHAFRTSAWEIAICGCALGFLMIAVVVIDLETMTIPDRFSMGGAFLGLVLSCFFPSIHSSANGIESFFLSLTGLLVGSSILFWIGAFCHRLFKREALGEGDVKLLGCIGAFCGWKGSVFTIFGGATLGCLIILPLALLSKLRSDQEDSRERNLEIGWGKEVPFGPFLAMAALLYFAGFDDWVEAWFSLKMDPILQFIGV